MYLEKHPWSRTPNIRKQIEIQNIYPQLDESRGERFLSIHEFITNSPEKYHDRILANQFSDFLETFSKSRAIEFVSVLPSYILKLDEAYRVLNEINKLDIHEGHLPKHDVEIQRFIDEKIHFNYFKLIEGVYCNFLLVVAMNSRITRNKNIEGLDVYNVIQEVKKGSFKAVCKPYNSTVRNGLGHGGVKYKEGSIIYSDKKGNTVELKNKNVVRNFDDLLDICNGLAVGFILFHTTNMEFFKANSFRAPRSMLMNELKAQANLPKWKVIDCLESFNINDQKQLTLYIQNSLQHRIELNYFGLRTAIMAEHFLGGYDRYFFSFKSEFSKYVGFAGYDGNILKKARLNDYLKLEDYSDVLDSRTIFFWPRFNRPNWMRKLVNLWTIIKFTSKDDFAIRMNSILAIKNIIRDTNSHIKKGQAVVLDPSVVLENISMDAIPNWVRANHRKLIKKANRHCKIKLLNGFGLFLPNRYSRVMIYDTNLRMRQLRNSGLREELICTISSRPKGQIPDIDIIGGKSEIHGRLKIVWNQNWKGISNIE